MIDPKQMHEALAGLLKDHEHFNPALLQEGSLLDRLKTARDQLDNLIRFIETKDPKLLEKMKSYRDINL